MATKVGILPKTMPSPETGRDPDPWRATVQGYV